MVVQIGLLCLSANGRDAVAPLPDDPPPSPLPLITTPYLPTLDRTVRPNTFMTYQKGPARVGMIPPGGRRKAASLRLHFEPPQRSFGQPLDHLVRPLFLEVAARVPRLFDEVGDQVGDLELPRLVTLGHGVVPRLRRVRILPRHRSPVSFGILGRVGTASQPSCGRSPQGFSG